MSTNAATQPQGTASSPTATPTSVKAPSSPTQSTEKNEESNDDFAGDMCFVTTCLRAIENAREDAIVKDPFAEPLSRHAAPRVMPLMKAWTDQLPNPENFSAIRTRYMDIAIENREPRTTQIVLLGAGLDTRAYHLDAFRGCHVFEMDVNGALFKHKEKILRELDASLVAKKLEYITTDLTQAGWEKKLLDSGFDPTVPTFWGLEGLLMYLDGDSGVAIMKTIHELSAPGSEFWADLAGRLLVEEAELGQRRMKHGEDDPVRGLFSHIPWNTELQGKLRDPESHFGREWTPILSAKTKQPVLFSFVVGKKPSTA